MSTFVTNRAHGPDVSKYDLQFKPELATKQIDFVIQRASYRLTKDELFDQLYPGVSQVPIRLAYHYFNSDKVWQDQADFFLNVVGNKDFHAYIVDFEDAFNVLSQKFAFDTWQFLRYLVLNTGKRAILYTGRYLYMEWLIPAGRTYGIDWNSVDYWQAQYYTPPQPDGQPVMPVGRTAGWNLWQYTSSAAGTDYGLGRPSAGDLNVFNGSVGDLRNWLGISEPTPPTQNPTASIRFVDADGDVYESDEVELRRV